MKLKKEYVILFIIIAVLVLYIALRKGNMIQYKLPEVAELAPADISGIVIQGDSKEIVLKKEKGKWLIGPEKYSADSYKVEKMINFLKNPVLMTVVSESKDYMRYGLDDKDRITVKALSGDSPKRLVEIGYQADVQNCTFIKLENDYRVYQAKEDLREVFSTDIDNIRDKSVLSFNIDRIYSVDLSRDGKETVFTKKEVPSKGKENKDKTTYQWETGDGKVIDVTLMNADLDDILKIKCSKYFYDTKKEEQAKPAYVIKVKDEKEHVLTVFPKKDDAYRAESSDNPTPFSLYAWRIDNIIKKFDEMLGKEAKKGPKKD